MTAALGQAQFDALVRDEAEVADLDTTRYVHTNRYVDALEALRPSEGYVYLDGGDTMMEPSTWEVVLRGVGATLQAAGKVLDGQVQDAFVACRPPGHHAGTEQAMRFCLFNNISIGTRYAQEKHGLERVAIVEFDVHGGKHGTQANTYAGGMAATVELIDGCRYEIAGSVQFPTPSEVTKDLGLDTLPTVDADVMSVNIGEAADGPKPPRPQGLPRRTHASTGSASAAPTATAAPASPSSRVTTPATRCSTTSAEDPRRE